MAGAPGHCTGPLLTQGYPGGGRLDVNPEQEVFPKNTTQIIAKTNCHNLFFEGLKCLFVGKSEMTIWMCLAKSSYGLHTGKGDQYAST